MKMTSEENGRTRVGQSSYEATMRHIKIHKEKGLYRRIIKLDPDTHELVTQWMDKNDMHDQSKALVEIITRYKEKGEPVTDSTLYDVDHAALLNMRRGFTVFVDDDTFDYLKMHAKACGLRKTAPNGLAIIIREV